LFANGKTQTLTWDGLGRLVSVMQRDASTNGFNWTAVYDGLGRRLRTIHTPVGTNVVYNLQTLVTDSYYDPQVEFLEVAVSLNGQRTWKVMGPDINGGYGSMQGVGGLEATIRELDGLTTPVIDDYFGNVLATVAGTNANWNPVRVGGYGPVNGYQAPVLSPSVPLAETLLWRSRRIDPSGFYCLGARYYDPLAAHLLSPDPLGHAASMDLYSAFGNDGINYFDPTGRLGKQVGQDVEIGWNTLAGTTRDVVNTVRDLTAQPGDPRFLELTVQRSIQGSIDYENGGEGWSGARNAINRYNLLRSPFEALSGEHLMDGPELGVPLTGPEKGVAWANTVSLLGSLGAGLPGTLRAVSADLRALTLGEVPPVITASDVAPVVTGTEAQIPSTIYRGGRFNESAIKDIRVDADGVSFRDSLSNPVPEPGQPPQPVLRPGKPYIEVETSKLPPGSVNPDGFPFGPKEAGHVSVTATREEIVNAINKRGSGKFPK
jgi:RHS repeat-associated protein